VVVEVHKAVVVVLEVVLVLAQLQVLLFKVVLVDKVLVHTLTGLAAAVAVEDTMVAAVEAAAMTMVLGLVPLLVAVVVLDT